MKRSCAILLLVLAACSSGCLFKKQPYKGVMSYRDGKVFLRKGDYYTVGMLPEGWERLATHAKTISFYDKGSRSSISTDAICDRSESNRSLSSLAGGMAGAVEDRKVVQEQEFMLDGRGALSRRVEGTLDGVPTVVDLVVTRKNECVFDFYLVAPKGADGAARADFDAFYRAFHYE
jgi:hypothetical protein